MFNDSIKYFWEQILGEDKFNAGIISAAIFVSAVQNSISGIAVGLAIILTYVLSAFICSFLAKVIPIKIRLFVYILINAIIATTISMFLLNVKLFWNYTALIDYIPVIAVSCAIIVCIDCPRIDKDYKSSLKDAFEIGITGALLILLYGVFREFLTSASILGINIPPVRGILENFHFFEYSSGGFILMGIIAGCMQKIHIVMMRKKFMDDGVKETAASELDN